MVLAHRPDVGCLDLASSSSVNEPKACNSAGASIGRHDVLSKGTLAAAIRFDSINSGSGEL